MTEEYNLDVAKHYAEYRPPLHQLILKECINNSEIFHIGLDIGCGTGHSAMALVDYCSLVYGVEPSESMLNQAHTHNKINYINSYGHDLPLNDSTISIVTFAGSLFYAKSPQLIQELKRVCVEDATVIVYDFEIILDKFLYHLMSPNSNLVSDYNHEINFSNDSQMGLKEINVGNNTIAFEVSSSQLSHLLLSANAPYNVFVKKYNVSEPHTFLVEELESIGRTHNLNARIYYSRYLLKGINVRY
jgi:ubiquinone/menaquinone biosynthesis C-methylase UbiE